MTSLSRVVEALHSPGPAVPAGLSRLATVARHVIDLPGFAEATGPAVTVALADASAPVSDGNGADDYKHALVIELVARAVRDAAARAMAERHRPNGGTLG